MDNTITVAHGLTNEWLNANATSTNYLYVPTATTTWVNYNWGNKIRLTLTEVERLRTAAKKNPALKPILSKFTDFIEIEVDFP